MSTKDTVPGVPSGSHTRVETLVPRAGTLHEGVGPGGVRYAASAGSRAGQGLGDGALLGRRPGSTGTEQDHLTGGTVGEVVAAATTLHPALSRSPR